MSESGDSDKTLFRCAAVCIFLIIAACLVDRRFDASERIEKERIHAAMPESLQRAQSDLASVKSRLEAIIKEIPSATD